MQNYRYRCENISFYLSYVKYSMLLISDADAIVVDRYLYLIY